MPTRKSGNLTDILKLFIASLVVYWPLNQNIFPSESSYTVRILGHCLCAAATITAYCLLTKMVVHMRKYLRNKGIDGRTNRWITFILWSFPMSALLGLWAWDKDNGIVFMSFPFVGGVLFSLFFGFMFFYLDEDGLKQLLGDNDERIAHK